MLMTQPQPPRPHWWQGNRWQPRPVPKSFGALPGLRYDWKIKGWKLQNQLIESRFSMLMVNMLMSGFKYNNIHMITYEIKSCYVFSYDVKLNDVYLVKMSKCRPLLFGRRCCGRGLCSHVSREWDKPYPRIGTHPGIRPDPVLLSQ